MQHEDRDKSESLQLATLRLLSLPRLSDRPHMIVTIETVAVTGVTGTLRLHARLPGHREEPRATGAQMSRRGSAPKAVRILTEGHSTRDNMSGVYFRENLLWIRGFQCDARHSKVNTCQRTLLGTRGKLCHQSGR